MLCCFIIPGIRLIATEHSPHEDDTAWERLRKQINMKNTKNFFLGNEITIFKTENSNTNFKNKSMNRNRDFI